MLGTTVGSAGYRSGTAYLNFANGATVGTLDPLPGSGNDSSFYRLAWRGACRRIPTIGFAATPRRAGENVLTLRRTRATTMAGIIYRIDENAAQ